MSDEQGLISRLRNLAKIRPMEAEEIEQAADSLEAACASGNALRILGCWARARKLFCKITGESLV